MANRQIDNIKRIYSCADDLQFQCNLLSFVESQYALPHHLARKYACILFIIEGKFAVNSKKRMQRVSLTQIENCASFAMACLIPDSITFTSYWNSSSDMDSAGMYTIFTHADFSLCQVRNLMRCSIYRCLYDDVGGNSFAWSSVWQLVASIQNLEPDRALLTSLREIKGQLSGDKLKDVCNTVKMALQSHHMAAKVTGGSKKTLPSKVDPMCVLRIIDIIICFIYSYLYAALSRC